MHTVVLETHKGISAASAFVSDNMFDDDREPMFAYGRNPDTAISRLLSDFPEITDYRIISRYEYERLWDQRTI